MTTLESKLNELEAVALAATPGPWEFGTVVTATDSFCIGIAQILDNAKWDTGQSENNSWHIATFNPQTVLALIQACRAMAEALESVTVKEVNDYGVDKMLEVSKAALIAFGGYQNAYSIQAFIDVRQVSREALAKAEELLK